MKFTKGNFIIESIKGEFRPDIDIRIEESEENLELINFCFKYDYETIPEKIIIKWFYTMKDVFACWNPLIGLSRNILPAWTDGFSYKASIGAPVQCVYSSSGQNRLTYALNDVLNAVNFKGGINEERAEYECCIELFTERLPSLEKYELVLRIDTRDIPYYDALNDVSLWWNSFDRYRAVAVPENAELPMYSTWYSFHQELSSEKIYKECCTAAELGCKTVIIDDGWQTEDNKRGYAWCGDWNLAQSKIQNMKTLSDEIHSLGMKVMLWYSVPFIGRNSENFERFRGRYLDSEDNDWCILDPRFSDVREFLTGVYEKAVKEWDLDGLKLDFIDSFKMDNHTPDCLIEGMDCLSIPEAVDILLKDVIGKLRNIKSDIMIEFRQNYTGPIMRSYGNMLRASDCPMDAIGNRTKTIDLRLLSGHTAVHSDMLMWNINDRTESAAKQIINVLFSVPQISVIIESLPEKHYKMLTYYIKFWMDNKDVFINGKIMPQCPEGLYSKVYSCTEDKFAAVFYTDRLMKISEKKYGCLVIVNGTSENYILLESDINGMTYSLEIKNCCGDIVKSDTVTIKRGLYKLNIPESGTAVLKKI